MRCGSPRGVIAAPTRGFLPSSPALTLGSYFRVCLSSLLSLGGVPYCHGSRQKSLLDSKPFPFLSSGGNFWGNLSSLGLASPETEGYLCILLPSWSSEQGCFYDQLLPMLSLLSMPAFIGLLWKEGPHRLLSQLMVFVIAVIRCPCSHALPLCPKGRNSGARCRPLTCHGSAWLF